MISVRDWRKWIGSVPNEKEESRLIPLASSSTLPRPLEPFIAREGRREGRGWERDV